jgi:hypothetical protein
MSAMPTDTSTPEIESPTIQLRRRYQQKKCLVCGAKQRATPWSLFCAAHIDAHRYCALCETVTTADAFGADRSRCQRRAAGRGRWRTTTPTPIGATTASA